VHTVFQSFEWNLLAARAFRREMPYVVATESGSESVLVPASLSTEGLSLIGEALFDYRDWLGTDDALCCEALRQLSTLSCPLDVTALNGSETCDRWGSIGLPTERFVNAPIVRRSDVDASTFEGWHHRSARQLRRLVRSGVSVHEHAGTNASLVRYIYDRKAAQVLEGGENLFADSHRRDFLVAAAGLGECDVFTLESAGSLVAALVTFRDGSFRRFYTTYYDHAWAHYSPGIALLFEVTRRSLASGFDCDYMTGEQTHKMRFATSSVTLYRAAATAEELREIGLRTNLLAA
jgi:CelD/BcsL family acetyltransferase involved in cellulose biosynthesis